MTLRTKLIREDQKARFECLKCLESGVWIDALPSPNFGTLLDNDTLRIFVALRLGSEICQEHTCIFGARVQSSGLHASTASAVKRSAGRWSRHLALNETIRRALESSGVPSRRAPTGVSRDDGKRPDGMTFFPWKKGRLLVWDATCTENMAPSYLTRTNAVPG